MNCQTVSAGLAIRCGTYGDTSSSPFGGTSYSAPPIRHLVGGRSVWR